MFDTIDRYSLALDVLKGEKDSHKVLADLLEEQGDRGLAQWGRARKGKRAKRLGFVLAVLPFRKALKLSCDFLEHPLAASEARSTYESIFNAINQVRDLSQSEFTAEFQHRPHSLWQDSFPYSDGIPLVMKTAEGLNRAASFAKQAAQFERRRDGRKVRACAVEVGVIARRIAKSAREIASGMAYQPGSYGLPFPGRRVIRPDELSWQVSRTQQTLSELLQHV